MKISDSFGRQDTPTAMNWQRKHFSGIDIAKLKVTISICQPLQTKLGQFCIFQYVQYIMYWWSSVFISLPLGSFCDLKLQQWLQKPPGRNVVPGWAQSMIWFWTWAKVSVYLKEIHTILYFTFSNINLTSSNTEPLLQEIVPHLHQTPTCYAISYYLL